MVAWILVAGSKAEADKLKGDSTLMNDLQGKTLTPGFIDGHCHFAGFGPQSVGANVLASPDGNGNSQRGVMRWALSVGRYAFSVPSIKLNFLV